MPSRVLLRGSSGFYLQFSTHSHLYSVNVIVLGFVALSVAASLVLCVLGGILIEATEPTR